MGSSRCSRRSLPDVLHRHSFARRALALCPAPRARQARAIRTQCIGRPSLDSRSMSVRLRNEGARCHAWTCRGLFNCACGSPEGQPPDCPPSPTSRSALWGRQSEYRPVLVQALVGPRLGCADHRHDRVTGRSLWIALDGRAHERAARIPYGCLGEAGRVAHGPVRQARRIRQRYGLTAPCAERKELHADGILHRRGQISRPLHRGIFSPARTAHTKSC